jgi:hypothetical protein
VSPVSATPRPGPRSRCASGSVAPSRSVGHGPSAWFGVRLAVAAKFGKGAFAHRRTDLRAVAIHEWALSPPKRRCRFLGARKSPV